MLRISKGEPWLFWPSSICDTFPENPANLYLDGNSNFTLEVDFLIAEVTDTQKTIFTIVPRFTALDCYPDKTVITITYEDRADYHTLNTVIPPGALTKVVFKHVKNLSFEVFINKERVVYEDLTKRPYRTFGLSKFPHVILGAGNFPKNDFNLNYSELEIHSFKVYKDDELVAHHNFEKQIFDKFVDVTNNLNFIHKI